MKIWATTSNKQLKFLQHVKSCFKIHGCAAIVVPDNVLFEGGAARRSVHSNCPARRTASSSNEVWSGEFQCAPFALLQFDYSQQFSAKDGLT
jgi:hypothetical protein